MAAPETSEGREPPPLTDSHLLAVGRRSLTLLTDTQRGALVELMHRHRAMPIDGPDGTSEHHYPDVCIRGCPCHPTPGYYEHIAALVLGYARAVADERYRAMMRALTADGK